MKDRERGNTSTACSVVQLDDLPLHGGQAGRVRRACDDAPLSFPVRPCDAPDLLARSFFPHRPLCARCDPLSLYDLPGAGFSCINLPRSEVFPAKCCAVVS
jgi:hypothetical protein